MKYYFAIICMLFAAQLAADTVVYQWVDKNKVTHFSQQPPRGVKYTEIVVKGAMASVNKNSDTNKTDNETALTNLAEKSAATCSSAKDNLKMLTSYEQVNITEKDGSMRLLSETEKRQQISLAEKQIEVYCDKD